MAKKTKEMAKEIPRKPQEYPKVFGGAMGLSILIAG